MVAGGMSTSVISCPHCSAALFEATDQCPACGHTITPDERQVLSHAAAPEPTRLRKNESPCPNCKEMVRTSAVRCWNCGTFMRADIEERYRQMQANPSPPIFSDLPDQVEEVEEKREFREADPIAEYFAEDADFEVHEDVTVQEADDDDFEFDPNASSQLEFELPPSPPTPTPHIAPVTPAAEVEPPPAAESETYELKAPEPKAADPLAETLAQAPSADAPPESEAAKRELPPEPEQAHSVATGGDVLLQVALQEEIETRKARGDVGRKAKVEGVLVFCPHGHRVVVQERHRGRAGRCPKCKSPFVVPESTWEAVPVAPPTPDIQLATSEAAPPIAAEPGPEAPTGGTISAGAFEPWITGVFMHTVNPAKLKLKAGSLKADYELADVGFSPEQILIAVVGKKAGFSGTVNVKKAEAARDAVLAHLREGKAAEDIPAPDKLLCPAKSVGEIKVVQPTLYEHESMFAGVPVFGDGRIAVKLPQLNDGDPIVCLSFTLTQFRQFSQAMFDRYRVESLGKEAGIPLQDEFKELKCNYSDTKMSALQHLGYYQADAAVELELIGRQCQGCGIAVCEDSRKKEKIGGVSGRGIARVKCPKCKKKFGDTSLYTLKGLATGASMGLD